MNDENGVCPRCGGPNPNPHLHERTGRPCFGPNAPWPAHLDEHGNPKPTPKPAATPAAEPASRRPSKRKG